MRQLVLVCGLLACSTPNPEPRPEPGFRPQRIDVPTTEGAVLATPTRAANYALRANEGSIEVVAPGPAKIGVATTAKIRIVPGKGFHINTSYPFVVSIADADGVTIAKRRLEGGRGGVVGDAETLVEQELTIPITVTPTTAGDHSLTGSINFGICKVDLCLTRAMPVSVRVVAS